MRRLLKVRNGHPQFAPHGARVIAGGRKWAKTNESHLGIRFARFLYRRRCHDRNGRLGAFAEAAWNSVTELRLPRPFDRSYSPRSMDAWKYCESNTHKRRVVDGMVCSLLDWSYLRSALTRRIRIAVGTKAISAPCTHSWDRNGYCATIHSATGTGSRNCVF